SRRKRMKTRPKEPAGGLQSRLREVSGRHNPLVKELRKAFAAGGAGPDGLFAIEGVRIIEEAIRSGVKFEKVFFSTLAEAKAERLLPQLGSRVQTISLPDSLFASAVPSESPQGVAAVVHGRTYALADILARSKFGPLLALAGIQDPGNLGTILRSAEAFGAT